MRVLQIIGAILIVFASPATAKDVVSAWIVSQKSGEVRVIRSGMQPASVNLRAALSPGDIVATGANGRAMLTRGDDYVVVAPDSRLALPKEQQETGFTRLIQQVGTMLYKVKRTGVPHFEVKTPMLAAVVKGTTFTVVVDQKGAAVQVTEGVVEVSSLTGDARRLVEGGMTVYVGRERPDEIIEVKSGGVGLPESTDDSAVQIEGSGDVSLTTITDLTDGLVRQAPVTLVAAASPVAEVVPTSSGSTTSPALAPVAPVDDLLAGTAPAIEDTLTGTTEPILSVVETTVPAITDPVVDIVQATVPAITEPVLEIVDTIVPVITEPIVEIVDTVVPVITDPVVEIVDTIVPVITEPVIDIVDATLPVLTQPVTDVVQTIPDVICVLLCGR